MENLELILAEQNPKNCSKPVSLKFTPIFGELAMIFDQDVIVSELHTEDGIERITPIGLYDPRSDTKFINHDTYGQIEVINLRPIPEDYKPPIMIHAMNGDSITIRTRYRISREQLPQ